MSQEHPELIFVAGPQKGQRVVLGRPVLLLGRGGGADIMLSEQYVSREQARYVLAPQGPTLENLSSRGTWITGKRFKAGKRVLLESGDLIGMGKETEALFVAAGDDPEAALAIYEQSLPTGKNAFGKKPKLERAPAQPKPPEEPAPVESESAEPEEVASTPQRGRKRPSDMSAEERLAVERKARRRKIAIGIGIYLGAILVLVVFLATMSGEHGSEMPMPRMLSSQEIEDALTAIPEKTPNRLFAEQKLEEALGTYQQYGPDSPNLYKCVRAFKQSLAYSGNHFFEDSEHDQIYREVLSRLTEIVKKKYRNAYLYEKNRDWDKAEIGFRKLLAMMFDETDVEKNVLFANVQAHHKRVKYYAGLKRPRKRTPW